jgi:hypothetical protein
MSMNAAKAALGFLAKMNERKKEDLIKWYDAMDVMRQSRSEHEVASVVELARGCDHQDARWLVALFPKAGATMEEVMNALQERSVDPRAMYWIATFTSWFQWWHGDWRHQQLFQRAAQLGYASAQARMAGRTTGCESLSWAEKAAVQGDRDGLFWLAECLWNGTGCETNKTEALRLYKEAGDLEHTRAQFRYGCLAFEWDNWHRYWWWGRAALGEKCDVVAGIARVVVEHLQLFKGGGRSGRVVFEIGAAFKRISGAEILPAGWGSGFVGDPLIVHALEECVVFHNKWSENAKRSIYCWVLVARQKNVPKDIRNVTCKMLWAERSAWSDRIIENKSKSDDGCNK